MRKKLFYAIVRPRVPEGCMLPTWARALRWLLFPLDTAYWVLGRSRGYQYDRDIWLIDGIRFAGLAMHMLATAQGETYRIARTGDVVTLERVVSLRDPEPSAWQCEACGWAQFKRSYFGQEDGPCRSCGGPDSGIVPLYRGTETKFMRDAVDADKYRFLEPRFLAADFDYGAEHETVLVFQWPKDAAIGADMTLNIQRARLAELFDGKKQANAQGERPSPLDRVVRPFSKGAKDG